MTDGTERSEACAEKVRATPDELAQRYIWLSLAFLALAVVAEVIGVVGWFKPDNEAPEIWFQRSGAVMTVFSLLAGPGVGSILNSIIPRGMHGLRLRGPLWPFNRRFVMYERAAMLMTIGGTIIWGYGDLIARWVNSIHAV